MPETKRPLKVFLCHAHADRDAVRTLYARLTKDGVDAWLDKAKLHGERSQTILPGQVSTGSTYQIGNWRSARLCAGCIIDL